MNRILLLMCGLSAQAHAQCGGWIHDKYTYGPNFEPGGRGRGVIWDIDGPSGARLPRLVLPARYNYGPFSSSAVDVVMRTSSGWNFMGSRVAFEPDSVRLLTMATLAGGQREVFIAGLRNDVSTGAKTCEVLRWSGTTWVAYGTGVSGELVDAIGWDPDGEGPEKPRVVIIVSQASGAAATVHQLIGAAWHRVGTIEGGLRVLHAWDSDGSGPLAETLVCAGVSWLMGRVGRVKKVSQCGTVRRGSRGRARAGERDHDVEFRGYGRRLAGGGRRFHAD
ncbi:MAG: hypothetical protein KF705_03360 [Phycisphaeraceae bacterium]|nr:hypothetical protein [Phycisphaeraceae bacterium]